MRLQALGEEHPNVARSLSGLAMLYWRQGKYEEAEPLYKQALRISELTLGEKHPDVARSLSSLAVLYGVTKGSMRKPKHSISMPCASRSRRWVRRTPMWPNEDGPLPARGGRGPVACVRLMRAVTPHGLTIFPPDGHGLGTPPSLL